MKLMAMITATIMSAMTRSLIQHKPEYEREFGQCHGMGEGDMLNDFKADSLQDEMCPYCEK